MKLAAVYNVWADTEGLLELSVRSIINYVDKVFIVYSNYSNSGENIPWALNIPASSKVAYIHYEPLPYISPSVNERFKRIAGLSQARAENYTHILTMDGDEFYTPSDLLNARNIIEADPSLNGMVVKSQVYFKRPDLTIGLDTTLVPFIHKITPTLTYQMNRKYPYAWVDNVIRIDPTRQFNITSGVMMSKNIIMHHYSYVRKDLEIKIRNSSARGNIENSTIREDWANAKEGYFCKFYGKTLTKCPNLFDLPLDW
jgi:hypothetical protein